MPKLPTAQDVKKVGKQMTDALEQARGPLYAVLGAGDLATEAVRDYLAKARTEAGGQAKDVQTRVSDLQLRLTELQDRLGEVRTQVRTQVRTRVNELPEELRKLDAVELRHALENYVQSLQDLYERLATRGETTLDKIRQQPQVKKAVDRVEDVADTTEVRVGKFVEDARELTYEVLGKVSRRTRSAGEKTAVRTERTAEKVAGEVADAIDDAGDEIASTTRSVSRKAANRTQPAKTSPKATTTTRKNTTQRKTTTKA